MGYCLIQGLKNGLAARPEFFQPEIETLAKGKVSTAVLLAPGELFGLYKF
jgi:hypothetical protein